MAANLIADPEISQTFVYDLKSVFYIMFWLSLRYLLNSYHPSTCGHILSNVFNPDPPDSPLSLGPSSLDSHCKPSTDSKVTWMVYLTSFCLGKVYLRKDNKKGRDVAVKLEVALEWGLKLKHKYNIYWATSGICGIPKMLWYGMEG